MGATDIWIAHQLGSTPASIAAFRQKNGLLRTGGAERPAPVEVRRAPPPAEAPKPRARTRGRARAADAVPAPEAETAAEPVGRGAAPEAGAVAEPDEIAAPAVTGEPADDEAAGERPRRRRGRRGGRGRGRSDGDTPLELEAVFDHGDEGYGLWLDAAVRDAGVYRAHWMGRRELTVRITPDEIVIRRADSPSDSADGD
jgi:hypothetical protein